MSSMRAVSSAAVSRPRSLLAALLVLAALAAVAAQGATGQTVPTIPGSPGTTGVEIKGSTVVRLEENLFETLTGAGAKVRAGKPATRTKTGVKLRVSAISLGRDGISYNLKHKGEMRISTSRRSLRMKNPTLTFDQTTGQGSVYATISRKRRKIGTLQIDIGTLEQTGSGVNAEAVITMNSRLAREINRLTSIPVALSGATFGRATIRVVTEA